MEHFDVEISFNALGDEGEMRGVWAEALPGVPWDQARWDAFRRKRIVCDRSKVAPGDLSRLEQLLHDEAEEIVVPPLW